MIVSSPRIKKVTHVAVKLTSQEIIIIRNNDFRYCFTLFPKCLDAKWQHGNTTHNIRLSLFLSCITTTSQEQLNLNWAQLWWNWPMNDFWFVTFSICRTDSTTWDFSSMEIFKRLSVRNPYTIYFGQQLRSSWSFSKRKSLYHSVHVASISTGRAY